MKLIMTIVIWFSTTCICSAFIHDWKWNPRVEGVNTRCGKHEFYSECGANCIADCFTYRFPQHPLINSCRNNGECHQGCFCKSNRLRTRKDGRCVPPRFCPTYKRKHQKSKF